MPEKSFRTVFFLWMDFHESNCRKGKRNGRDPDTRIGSRKAKAFHRYSYCRNSQHLLLDKSFVWLIKREVRLNLEFLADKKVMEAGFATKSYQYHLLGLAYNHKYGLSNNFNFSHLKQRIIMMNKKNQMVQRILNMHCSPFRPLLYSLPETSPARRMHRKNRCKRRSCHTS